MKWSGRRRMEADGTMSYLELPYLQTFLSRGVELGFDRGSTAALVNCFRARP